MRHRDAVFFPGLNGLRAIAALAVVASHATIAMSDFQLSSYLIGELPNGNPKSIDLSDFAVSIFFALSGFLITYLLLVENSRQEINIRNFYVRRILRIWPLYYLYFILAYFAIAIWDSPHPDETNVFYIFFMANVPKTLQLRSDLLGHYWSLGVEEQFYLFWPFIVKVAQKRLQNVTLAVLAFLVTLKLVAHFFFSDYLIESVMVVNRFDCMMVGALGAILYFQQRQRFIFLATHPLAQLAGWTALTLAALNKFHIAAILDHEFMSGITVVLILGQIAGKRKIVNLDKGVFEFLGKISYGLYVIHPMVIFLLPKVWPDLNGLPEAVRYTAVYVAVTGLTVLMAHLSYEYFEKPFLKLKERFSSVVSSGSKKATVIRPTRQTDQTVPRV